jgi:hypothetical protein
LFFFLSLRPSGSVILLFTSVPLRVIPGIGAENIFLIQNQFVIFKNSCKYRDCGKNARPSHKKEITDRRRESFYG